MTRPRVKDATWNFKTNVSTGANRTSRRHKGADDVNNQVAVAMALQFNGTIITELNRDQICEYLVFMLHVEIRHIWHHNSGRIHRHKVEPSEVDRSDR